MPIYNPTEQAGPRPWAFLTSHANVLLCIAADPDVRQRDIATILGFTDRSVQRIIAGLRDAGYLTVNRAGRRARYMVNTAAPLRGPFINGATVGELVALARTGLGASRRGAGRGGR